MSWPMGHVIPHKYIIVIIRIVSIDLKYYKMTQMMNWINFKKEENNIRENQLKSNKKWK